MLRRCICFLWSVVMVMGAGGQAIAAGQMGTICIRPRWCGNPVAGGTVTISRVGTADETGYILTDGLADWKVGEDALVDRTWISWLSQKETGKEITLEINENGALFENLEEGVYLISQQENPAQYIRFDPFLVQLPEGECRDIVCTPKLIRLEESPRTADRPAPLVGAMGIGLSVAFLMVLVDQNKK